MRVGLYVIATIWFPARARKNTLNKSIHVFIHKKHHLIWKLYFDISDEIMIIIIIRKQLDIIILCLETVRFFFLLFIHSSIYIIVHIEIV